MAEAAQSTQHEFWRPPMPAATDAAGHTGMIETCDHCSTEFIVDSRFCHSCGARRTDLHQGTAARFWEMISFSHFLVFLESLGLSTAPFIAFVIGVICLLGALGVGMIFSARTIIDWQAVQLWRIEWLLGAMAAFMAGCLLKKAR